MDDPTWRRSAGSTLVHGDYGPNNVLIDPTTWTVSAVLDWEWVHRGEPVEDLAWCEWITRMHHPEHVALLDHFFSAYRGPVPGWEVRQTAMLTTCQSFVDLFVRTGNAGGEAKWRRYRETTEGWSR